MWKSQLGKDMEKYIAKAEGREAKADDCLLKVLQSRMSCSCNFQLTSPSPWKEGQIKAGTYFVTELSDKQPKQLLHTGFKTMDLS